ncbi:MAG TPA: SAM-dependent methyltransferase [Candidatus Saccharimonadia bacterium]
MLQKDPSSFRDNFGFVFWTGGRVYRQINPAGKATYDQLMVSGLHKQLVKDGLIVDHEEVPPGSVGADGAYRVIRPELVPFISYPYEWSFSQLQDAALATLRAQKLALDAGMTLRDATAYNVQFVEGRPRLIDTLSFDEYLPGDAWVAYRQFCQHFLAPLALMSRVDPDLLQLMRVYIDGIPLPLAAKLLPARAALNLGLATHVHLHARFQRRHEGTGQKAAASVSRESLLGLIDSLERTVRAMRLSSVSKTEWGDYYDNTNYTDASFKAKEQITSEFVQRVEPDAVLDLGSNDGTFSRIAAKAGALVVSADIDPLAVDANYLKVKKNHETRLLPILVDLHNPSPDLGWANQERSSFAKRARAKMVLSLALIHHLAISNNLPFDRIAEYFAGLGTWLVIEFVPKSDSKVKRLLATREDIFPEYTSEGFEKAFGEYYEIREKQNVAGSERIMYLMQRKDAR